MKTKKKLFYLSLGFSFLLLTVFSSNALGVHIPGGGGGGGFFLTAMNGQMITGSDESGDYTDTFTYGEGSYDVKPKRATAFFGWIKFFKAEIDFTFPYQSSWDSSLVIIDIDTPRLSDTFITVYLTGGPPVSIIPSSNGINYIILDTQYEVYRINIWYNTDPVDAGGDWIKIDYLAVYTNT